MKTPLPSTLLAAALPCGCATPTLPPLRDGSTVTLQVAAGPGIEAPMAIRNLALGKGVTAGVSTGMVIGSLWGLACGPLFVLCMPIGAAAGSGVGAAAEGSMALVRIELQSLRLSTTRDDRVSLEMHVQVAVSTGAGSTLRQKDCDYVSPLAPLAMWLDERSDLLDTSLSTACQQIASQIVGDLSIPP